MEPSLAPTRSAELTVAGIEGYTQKVTKPEISLASMTATILEAIRGKDLRIRGTELSKKHVRCFDAEVLDSKKVKIKDPTHLETIMAMVETLTRELFKSKQNEEVGEETIQQNSTKFLGELRQLLGKPMEVYNRFIDADQVEYCTMLFNKHQKPCATVYGEVGEMLRFYNAPLLFAVDKAPTEDLSGKKHLAQALAAVKGVGEAFKPFTGHDPPRFWGLMRNGTDWVFVRRKYSSRFLSHTAPIRVATRDMAGRALHIDEEGVVLVAKMLYNVIADTTALVRSVSRAASIAASHEVESEFADSEYSGMEDGVEWEEDEAHGVGAGKKEKGKATGGGKKRHREGEEGPCLTSVVA